MAPGGVPAPPEARGREPPSSSSLTSSLDGRRVSPLVHALHGTGGARAPPRLDLSLCLSLFLRSQILPFHHFLYIRRSVTPIGLKPSPRFFSENYRSCNKRRASTAFRGAHEGQGRAPCLMAPSGTVSRWFFFPKIINIPKMISVRFYPVWTPFDMGFLRNIKHASNRNWH